jgi:hypothetical protein
MLLEAGIDCAKDAAAAEGLLFGEAVDVVEDEEALCDCWKAGLEVEVAEEVAVDADGVPTGPVKFPGWLLPVFPIEWKMIHANSARNRVCAVLFILLTWYITVVERMLVRISGVGAVGAGPRGGTVTFTRTVGLNREYAGVGDARLAGR